MTHLGRIPLSKPRVNNLGADPNETGEVILTALKTRPGVGLEVNLLESGVTEKGLIVALSAQEAVKLHALLGQYLDRPCAFKADDLPRAADAFRRAWHQVDDTLPMPEGHRTLAGLKAALIELGFDEEV